MNDEADVLKFKKEHRQLIEDYLKAQLEWDLSTHFERWDSDNCKRNLMGVGEAGLALKDAGVFEHKWHLRTSWELRYYDEVIEDRAKDKQPAPHPADIDPTEVYRRNNATPKGKL